MSSTRLAYSVEAWEQQMLVVATQLLDVSDPVCCPHHCAVSNLMLLLSSFFCVQTLELLHVRALICHLDITNTNVMMQAHSTYMWDSLRLIDFGFARSFDKGVSSLPTHLLQTVCVRLAAAALDCTHVF